MIANSQLPTPNPWPLLLFGLFILTFFAFTVPTDVSAAVIQRPPNNLDLVGYWSMDEGRGNSVGDMSGSGNDGTMQGDPQWTDGKSGKALDFDGSGDYVSVSEVNAFETVPVSVFTWIKTSSYPTGGNEQRIVSLDSNGKSLAWLIQVKDNQLEISIHDGNGRTDQVVTSPKLQKDRWQLVGFTYKSDGSVAIYIDGGQVDTFSKNGSFQSTNCSITAIGSDCDNNDGENWDGSIDDTRIYSRALTASEVEDLYEAGSDRVTRNTTNTDRFTDGLVGHWTLDGTDTDVSGGTATDVSGNGNDGTLNGDPKQAYGRVGQALEFDGDGDTIGTPLSPASSEGTIMAWVKPNGVPSSNETVGHDPTSGDSHIISWRTNGRFRVRMWDQGASESRYLSSTDTFTNEWVHTVFSWKDGEYVKLFIDGDFNTSTPLNESYKGSSGYRWANTSTDGGYLSGKLDDARIYNKALSTSTIKSIYNATKPQHENVTRDNSENSLSDGLVGHWTFDGPDVDGSTASDISGSGNDGTLNGDTAPTFGKIGQALEFDEDGDYIDVGDAQNLEGFLELSVTAWVKYDELPVDGENVSTRDTIIAKYDAGNNQREWSLIQGNNVNGNVGDGATLSWNVQEVNNNFDSNSVLLSNSALTAGDWYHISVTWKSNESMKIYINGSEDASMTSNVPTDYTDTDEPLLIGATTDGTRTLIDGKLDDVRIYNRALSVGEVERLYNMGR